MHVICPHCKNPIELVRLDPRQEITCTACGSTFRIDGDRSTTGAPPPAGSIGRFAVVETVGHGGFGTVFKARDPQLDRTVAVKVPRRGNVGEHPQDVDRFLREARSVAQLRHPNIVSIHEVGLTDGVPYLVSDFVEGVTLSDVLTARRPPAREAARLVADVADALHHAHRQGVVHRDVKPSNIMIRPDGSPVVADFGLAKREAGEITMTLDGQVLGTPAYMSPEQARGEGHRVDGRSDVYSLGVILYLLLTGELPFRGNTRMLLHQVLHDEPKPPRALNDKVPRDLETVTLKAMAKEPARRYATAADLAADLRRFLGGEPIVARPVGRAERAWRWARRNPGSAGLGAALAASVLTGLGLVSWQWYRAEREGERAERNLALYIDAMRSMSAAEAAIGSGGGDREGERAERNLAVARDATRGMSAAEAAIGSVGRVGDEALRHGRYAEAEVPLRAALDGLRVLVREDPARDYRLPLAQASNRLATCLRHTGREKDALPLYRESLAVLDGLVKERPDNRELRSELGLAHRNRARALRALDQRDAAAVHYQKAETVFQSLATDYPAAPGYHAELAESLLGWALVSPPDPARWKELLDRGLAAVRRARAIDPGDPYFTGLETRLLVQSAEVALHADDHALVLARMDDLFPRIGGRIDVIVFGDILARSASWSTLDPSLPDKRRAAVTEQYLTRLANLVREAKNRGWQEWKQVIGHKELTQFRTHRLIAEAVGQ